jgi:hypothetical protein
MESNSVRLDVSDSRSIAGETSDDIQLLAPHQISRRPFPGLPLKWNRPCTIATLSTAAACVLLMLVILCFLRPHITAAWPPLDLAASRTPAPCSSRPSAADGSMYPAVRKRAASIIRSIDPSLPRNTWAFLVGGQDTSLGYSDTEVPFRQESNFLYLTGWNMSGAMALFSVDDGSLHLLLQVRCAVYQRTFHVKPLQEWTESDALWNGPRESLESAAVRLQCNVSLASSVAAILMSLSPALLLTLPGPLSPILSPYNVSSELLLRALAVSRAVKLPQEIELIAAATSASLRAHAIVQQRAAPGDSEGEIAALFRFSNEDCGLPFQA